MSKGGHSNKGDFEPRPLKSMVNFDGKVIDVYNITDIEEDDDFYDEESETGTCFAFIVTANWRRHEFKYKTKSLRDKQIKKFRAKMLALGCTII